MKEDRPGLRKAAPISRAYFLCNLYFRVRTRESQSKVNHAVLCFESDDTVQGESKLVIKCVFWLGNYSSSKPGMESKKNVSVFLHLKLSLGNGFILFFGISLYAVARRTFMFFMRRNHLQVTLGLFSCKYFIPHGKLMISFNKISAMIFLLAFSR